MKKLLLTWVIVFLTLALALAQTENTFEQTFTPKEDCYFAVFALNGPTTVQTWEAPTIKIIYTITAEKRLDEIVLQQIEMKFYEEERVMIFEWLNQEEIIMLEAREMADFLEVEIFVPKGIKYYVVPTKIHPLL